MAVSIQTSTGELLTPDSTQTLGGASCSGLDTAQEFVSFLENCSPAYVKAGTTFVSVRHIVRISDV